MSDDPLHQPVDPHARSALARQGLDLVAVDPADAAAVRAYSSSTARGFLEREPTAAEHEERLAGSSSQRARMVLDPGLAEPALPVATIDGWPTRMSLPGGDILAWAVSGVTVSPTHRRRGIARALVEAELRAAVDAGFPLACLTVSEATIYGRYGFGPAAWATEISVDTSRAGWLGSSPTGRVQFVSRELALGCAADVKERARLRQPGDVACEGSHLRRLFGLDSDPDSLRRLRHLRYDDASGDAQGLATYRVEESAHAGATVTLLHLTAATDDAYAALWRFLLDLDLVDTVVAPLRSVDEPLRWLVADPRAIRTTSVKDHHWLRVLDPATALAARRYSASGTVVLEISDPLGHASGLWRLSVDDSRAVEVDATSAPADLTVGVAELGSALLGGVSLGTLAAAGRVREHRPGSLPTTDAMFASAAQPWLSTWY